MVQAKCDPAFERTVRAFSEEGELLSLNLAMVAEALDIITDLNSRNVGGETVEQRIGEHKSWDPEIFKVDKDTENNYRKRLEESGRHAVLLSEEAGRLEINKGAGGDVLYAVCDPFDGSYLFKRGIPDFWYSSFSFFDGDFKPLCCAVGDAVQRKIAFAGPKGAFIADLKGGRLVHRFKLDKSYRDLMGRKEVTEPDGASIESYAMKPKKFLIPIVEKYSRVLAPFKFFLPNGGPYAFADVAEGKIDVYFASRQPFVDIFSGVMLAEASGACVTDFEGNPVKCSDNVSTVLDVVASTNKVLHDKVLAKIAECK